MHGRRDELALPENEKPLDATGRRFRPCICNGPSGKTDQIEDVHHAVPGPMPRKFFANRNGFRECGPASKHDLDHFPQFLGGPIGQRRAPSVRRTQHHFPSTHNTNFVALDFGEGWPTDLGSLTAPAAVVSAAG